MTEYFAKTIATIEDAIASLDEKKFDELVTDTVKALDAGHKIVVSGLGKNVPVCEKFVGSMTSLGQNAAFMHTNSAVHGDLGMVNEGDIVIILTKSGKTAESVYLESLLAKRNCIIWLLTFEEKSILREKIAKSLVLRLDHEGDKWNIMPNNSTTVNLIVLQGLAMETAKRRYISLADFKKNHPGGHIGEQLKSV